METVELKGFQTNALQAVCGFFLRFRVWYLGKRKHSVSFSMRRANTILFQAHRSHLQSQAGDKIGAEINTSIMVPYPLYGTSNGPQYDILVYLGACSSATMAGSLPQRIDDMEEHSRNIHQKVCQQPRAALYRCGSTEADLSILEFP